MDRIIFHIDVNSAYLSWEAVYRLQHGSLTDLRTLSSAIGGDEKSRHGIILAKSEIAKKYGIKTGESLREAKSKCPEIMLIPPNYRLYMKCSNAFYEILCEYSSLVQRYSVDECFLDYTDSQALYGDPLEAAYSIKERVKKELGFTVNIGISSKKLLAKMASELEKPDKVHTIFEHEIKEKMWPLPIEELFMVGRRTAPKLRGLGIKTIGDLAKYDRELIRIHLKSFGEMIWNYANGIDSSTVKKEESIQKGIGNSTTISYDVTDRKEAHLVLLSLTEMVSMRLREADMLTRVISVSVKNFGFSTYSHQRKLPGPTDCTMVIYENVTQLFDQVWKGEPIRHLGVHLTDLCGKEFYQISIFDKNDRERQMQADRVMDALRKKYGNDTLVRSSFINSGIRPIRGGVGEDNYQMMSSLL